MTDQEFIQTMDLLPCLYENDIANTAPEVLEQKLITDHVTKEALEITRTYFSNAFTLQTLDIFDYSIGRRICDAPYLEDLAQLFDDYNIQLMTQISLHYLESHMCPECEERNICEAEQRQERYERCSSCLSDVDFELYTSLCYHRIIDLYQVALDAVQYLGHAIWALDPVDGDLVSVQGSWCVAQKEMLFNDAQMTLFADFLDQGPIQSQFALSKQHVLLLEG